MIKTSIEEWENDLTKSMGIIIEDIPYNIGGSGGWKQEQKSGES